MKCTKVLATILAAVLISSTGCGVSDSIKSLLLTSSGANNNGFYNLAGADSTLQLKVFAVYHSGKLIDVTNDSKFSAVVVGSDQDGNAIPPFGPTTVPINKTGLMTAIETICTWTDATDNTKTPPAPANPPIWEYTGYYQTTATYREFTSQPVAIGVGSLASKNSPLGGCGPS